MIHFCPREDDFPAARAYISSELIRTIPMFDGLWDDDTEKLKKAISPAFLMGMIGDVFEGASEFLNIFVFDRTLPSRDGPESLTFSRCAVILGLPALLVSVDEQLAN